MVTYYDRIKVATATTGTGTITLGSAESGYRTMVDAAIPDGTSVTYVIEDATAWETGTGVTGGSGTTLTRTLRESSTASLLNLSGGAKVFITALSTEVNAMYASITSPAVVMYSWSTLGGL